MNEIKIRFRSGNVGYFKLLNSDIEELFDVIGDAISNKIPGVIEVIDLADDKKTIVNIEDISTFGYKNVKQ